MTVGCAVCFRLETYQEQNCRRPIGVTRFIYSIGVATEVFRHAKPAWRDLYKKFSAGKLEDHPSGTEVASWGQEGASMNFGTAMKIWPNPNHPAGPPRLKKENRAGAGSFRAV